MAVLDAQLPVIPDETPALRQALFEAKERLQETYGDRLRYVVLYGSRARGDARPDSDVDLLVVLKGPIENAWQETKRAMAPWDDLLMRYGLDFSIKPYTEEVYEDLGRPFIQNVREDAIEL